MANAGDRFGRLVFKNREQNDGKGRERWICECDCGKIDIFQSSHIKSGATKSCGCLHKELLSKIRFKHGCSGNVNGKRKSIYYTIWQSMRDRCKNKNSNYYHNYGGRGIKVSEEFHDFITFYNYLMETIGPRPAGDYSIDRINNDGNYEKGNLRWATRKEQRNNQSRMKRTNTH
jgi:hypothetical protein